MAGCPAGDDFSEIAAFDYEPFEMGRMFRLLTARRPTDKPHHITGENYVSRRICTNNRQISDLDVVFIYSQRGKIDKNFDVLNNDWNWNKLPFSCLSENTTYMLFTAMGMVMYSHLVNLFASRLDFVAHAFYLKALRFNAINVLAEWRRYTRLIHYKSRYWEQLAGFVQGASAPFFLGQVNFFTRLRSGKVTLPLLLQK